MQPGSEDLALVPVWAVRHRDQIRARFDATRGRHVRDAWGRVDLQITIRRDGAGSLILDGLTLRATADGSPLPLSPQGFAALEHLIRAERVVPTDELMAIVWGTAHARSGSTLRALIHHVRRSLPDTWSPCLTTVRLHGYRWSLDR